MGKKPLGEQKSDCLNIYIYIFVTSTIMCHSGLRAPSNFS